MSTIESASIGPDARALEIRCALGLLRVKGIGSMRACKLVGVFGSARAVLGASIEALVRSGLVNEAGALAIRNAHPVAHDDPVVVFHHEHRAATSVLLFADEAYPDLLGRISQPPMLLWARGRATPKMAPAVAIVGSRRASDRGRRLAWKWAYRLASAGVTVVSGLAEGIDAAAHEGALAAGGYTVAVVGTGIDRVYPAGNRALAMEIARSGLILSEFDPGTGPRAHHFPRRNRIIAGLSHMVVVVEAEEESGSLITARMAQDENREVGLVPGWPGDPNSAGTNAGIRECLGGLLTAPEDILHTLDCIPSLDWTPPEHERAAVDSRRRPDRETRRRVGRRSPVRSGTPKGMIRQHLQAGPASAESLLMVTHMDRASLETALLDLLLEDRIRLGDDQRYHWHR